MLSTDREARLTGWIYNFKGDRDAADAHVWSMTALPQILLI
ncbi:hypothetical protein [Allomesorhizobium camelthorni]|nr:hypothetical protein [Mesorhizobium camelthorni]